MKVFFIAIAVFGIIGCGSQEGEKVAGTIKPASTADSEVIGKTDPSVVDTVRKSVKAFAKNNINGITCFISYHSPAVRQRIIWGGLVPFDNPWVTGAHMATSLEVSADFTINGQKIPAGKYALFTIPSSGDWTFIVNKNWEQHLADEYNASDDVIRLPVRPDTLSYVQERLRYEIDQTGEYKARIEFSWEKLHWAIPISFR